MVSKGENHLKLVEETNRLSVHKRGQVVLRFGISYKILNLWYLFISLSICGQKEKSVRICSKQC